MHNVPSSAFWFENFCFLPFLRGTSIQKWKKNWFSYAHKKVGKKEMSGKILKCLCWNLFIGAAAQIRAVYKDHKILVYNFVFKFLDSQYKICVVLWLWYRESIFRLFKVNWKELRLVFVHRVNTDCTYILETVWTSWYSALWFNIHKYNHLVIIVREFLWDNFFQIMFLINILTTVYHLKP